MRNRSKYKATPDELARIQARREARAGGTEYRPITAAKAAEAERLNRGLEMLEEDGNADSEE